jgi:hypothetical protein
MARAKRHLVQLQAVFWTDKDNQQQQQQHQCFVHLSIRYPHLLKLLVHHNH